MTRRSCPTFEELSQLFSAKNRDMIATHLASCDACAGAWSDLEALREAAQQIPTRTPSAAEAIRLEDHLLAAALAPAPSAARWRRYVAPIAAAAVAAGVTLFFTARLDDAPRTAVVQAPAGAQFEHFTRVERDAPREVVRIREGRVAIEAADETAPLEVLTADGTIEVSSSDFEVVVVDDRLSEVFVRSGQVAVRTPDGTTHIVRLGERWTRPARWSEAGVTSNAARREPLGSRIDGAAGEAGANEGAARGAPERAEPAGAGVRPSGAGTSPREGGAAASMGAGPRGASASSRSVDGSAPSRTGSASASASSRTGAASRGASAPSRGGHGSSASASSRTGAASPPSSSRADAASSGASAPSHAEGAGVTAASSSRAGAAFASSRAGTASPGASRSAADARGDPAAPGAASASAGGDASPDAGTTTPPLPTPAERAFASGWRRLRAGDPTTAAERFAEVLEHQPGGALAEDARYWRAAALAKADAAEATPALRAYLSAHPDGRRSAEVALMLAWRRLAAGDAQEAKALFERAEATGDARVKKAARRGLDQL